MAKTNTPLTPGRELGGNGRIRPLLTNRIRQVVCPARPLSPLDEVMALSQLPLPLRAVLRLETTATFSVAAPQLTDGPLILAIDRPTQK